MIGQYLSNNNENATVPILQKKLHLNRAQGCSVIHQNDPKPHGITSAGFVCPCSSTNHYYPDRGLSFELELTLCPWLPVHFCMNWLASDQSESNVSCTRHKARTHHSKTIIIEKEAYWSKTNGLDRYRRVEK
jgi:hypothetical protein